MSALPVARTASPKARSSNALRPLAITVHLLAAGTVDVAAVVQRKKEITRSRHVLLRAYLEMEEVDFARCLVGVTPRAPNRSALATPPTGPLGAVAIAWCFWLTWCLWLALRWLYRRRPS